MRGFVWIVVALAVLALSGCSGGDDGGNVKPTATEQASVGPTPRSGNSETRAVAAEADADPSLPGEYIDLPAIYGAPYPYGPPPPHQDGPIDYSAQGLPPAGGLHWGPSAGWAGPCPDDPEQAPLNCGPVPWGVFRSPWRAESLVHNLEHAGVVIWYNTSDQDVIEELEAFAQEQLNADTLLVLAPYPDMDEETVAITIWSRRDMFPAEELDTARLQNFIDVLYCRFDPEGFC